MGSGFDKSGLARAICKMYFKRASSVLHKITQVSYKAFPMQFASWGLNFWEEVQINLAIAIHVQYLLGVIEIQIACTFNFANMILHLAIEKPGAKNTLSENICYYINTEYTLYGIKHFWKPFKHK